MGIGQIAKSAIEVGLAVANKSGEITPERATSVLRAWEAELGELWQPDKTMTDSASELQEVTKTVAGKARPAGDFLVVEDSTKPSTWHLPVKVNGKPDHRLMGGAWAALHGGYRGQKYQGPDKVTAISKLKALYKSEGMETPGEQKEAAFDASAIDETTEAAGSLRDTARRVEDSFHAAFSPKDRWEGPYRDRDVFMGHPMLGDSVIIDHREEGVTYAVPFVIGEDGIEFSPRGEWKQVELAYVPMQQAEAEVESDGLAVKLADATEEDTATLSEAETAVIEAGRRAPVVIDFQILKPGPGNKRQKRYYPAEVVERDIHVFQGVHVFTTDHKEKERSERTKVGKVLACPTRFTEAKAPVAQVLIYDPNQAEKARNRADAGVLDTLECSIFGNGQAREGQVGGKLYKIVESITRGRYLELVSKAGAGGKALNLAESEPGGKSMDEEKDKADATPVEEVEIEEAEAAEQKPEQKQEPQTLGAEVVKEALAATNLPGFVKATLGERQYKSDDELKEAIDAATAEVKKLSGSGAVKDLGESESAEEEPSLEEREQRRKDKFNEIMRDIQLKEV